MRRLLALFVVTTVSASALGFSALAAPASPPATAPKRETVKEPAAGTAEATIADALRAAFAGNLETYLELVHPDERTTKEQRSQRERYEWKRFSKQAAWYVVTKEPLTFVVTRRVVESETKVKIFMQDQVHADRSPTPIVLEKVGGRWHIKMNSL